MRKNPQGSAKKRKISHLDPITRSQSETQRRVFDALGFKRRQPELSLTAAAKQAGTTVKTIRLYAGSALVVRSGRLDVAPTDRISRSVRFLTARGQINISVTSRDASRIGRYSNAVRRLIIYGDDSALARFEGKTLRAGGQTYTFLTDKMTINRLARAGEISFMDIYSSIGGAR